MDKDKSSNSGGVGVFGAAAIGIGGMVGGGIFAVLGTAVSLAHGGTWVAFTIAGVLALMTCYSYSKLSVAYPNEGGTVHFFDQVLGVGWLTGSLNLLLWLSYLVTIAMYAVAFGSYGVTFFPDAANAELLKHVLLSAAIVGAAAINLANAELVSRSELVVVVVKLILLAVVVVAGMGSVDTGRIAPAQWAPPMALVSGGMVIFVAYEGFELIANASSDVRNPKRTLPLAFFGSVGFVVVLYLLIAIVTVGAVPPEVIAASEDYALAEAARPSLGQAGFTLVAVSALLATFSAINATIYGNARLGFSIAEDSELPAFIEKKWCHRSVNAILVTSLLSLVLANSVDLTAIAIMGSAGFLVIFTAVNVTAWRAGRSIGATKWIPALAAVSCFVALVVLLIQTYETDKEALWVFALIVGAAVIFEGLFPLTKRRMKKRREL